MPPATKFNISIKRETLIGLTGIVWLLAVFIFQREQLRNSSPLALLIITWGGLIISFKYKLAGGMFLFFGGLALAAHSFMLSTTFWLVTGAAIAGLAGFITFINWWKQKGN